MDYSEIKIKDKKLDYWFRIMAKNPCREEEFIERKEFLQRVLETCQRLGFDTSNMSTVYDRIQEGNANHDLRKMIEAVDMGFPILEKILTDAENYPLFENHEGIQEAKDIDHNPLLRNWACYGGDLTHKASSPDPGPLKGKIRWKQPLGYAWYSKPLILGKKVICASPGINTCGFIFDIENGTIIHRIERIFKREGWDDYKNNITGASYVYQAASSTPLLIDGEVAFNQLGAQGFQSGEKDIFFVNPDTGLINRSIAAGE